MGTDIVAVHGLPPIWGLPNPSPFAIKLLTWLRMANVPHELRVLRRPPRSSSGKIPYIDRPDGSVLSDSATIIRTLAQERGIDLDDGLDESTRALGHVVRRTFEESLYFVGLYERFFTPEGYAVVRMDYVRHLPWPIRTFARILVRRNARRNAWGQGIARHTREQVAEIGRADLTALSAILGSKPFFLGETPRTVDATALAFLWGYSRHPFESALRKNVEKLPNLLAFVARMRERYWADVAELAPERVDI